MGQLLLSAFCARPRRCRLAAPLHQFGQLAVSAHSLLFDRIGDAHQVPQGDGTGFGVAYQQWLAHRSDLFFRFAMIAQENASVFVPDQSPAPRQR
jgi:hypothetical protein